MGTLLHCHLFDAGIDTGSSLLTRKTVLLLPKCHALQHL